MTVAMLSEQHQTFRKSSYISLRAQHLIGRITMIDRSDLELLVAGGMSNIDLDLGNESGVVVTGVELESIAPATDVSRHTFGLKQVCSYIFTFVAKLDCDTQQSSTAIFLPPQAAGPSSSNLKPTLDAALIEYKKNTRKDLQAIWLASDLQTCESADSVLDLLRDQAKALDRSDNQKLMEWIDPLVHVLSTFSDALDNGVSLVRIINIDSSK